MEEVLTTSPQSLISPALKYKIAQGKKMKNMFNQHTNFQKLFRYMTGLVTKYESFRLIKKMQAGPNLSGSRICVWADEDFCFHFVKLLYFQAE
ncbi:hypothetical protein QVD17_27898 [Tagetes erecta]|uniref:Uncharacterized protein n=1 Tax=Tagetes erecta TaxID=13708 RepID=A0AAD8KE35_TARER|nr:hypothetical protein QVD17_27898 [Tagetes erecta]